METSTLISTIAHTLPSSLLLTLCILVLAVSSLRSEEPGLFSTEDAVFVFVIAFLTVIYVLWKITSSLSSNGFNSKAKTETTSTGKNNVEVVEEEDEEVEDSVRSSSSSSSSRRDVSSKGGDPSDPTDPTNPTNSKTIMSSTRRHSRKNPPSSRKKRSKKPEKPDSSSSSCEDIAEKSNTTNVVLDFSQQQCKQYLKLGLAQSDIYYNLLNYVLTPEQLRRSGFPFDHHPHDGSLSSSLSVSSMDSDDSDILNHTLLNIRAKEFVPRTGDLKTCARCYASFSLGDYEDILTSSSKMNSAATATSTSSTSSSTSTSSKRRRRNNNNNNNNKKKKNKKKKKNNSAKTQSKQNEQPDQQQSNDQQQSDQQQQQQSDQQQQQQQQKPQKPQKQQHNCRYHHGKLRSNHRNEKSYTCCGQCPSKSSGCTFAAHHVWIGSTSIGSSSSPPPPPSSSSLLPSQPQQPPTSVSSTLPPFVTTKYRDNTTPGSSFGIYALDCEMAFTVEGMQLVKVTVVGVDGCLVYESYVMPESPIIDHNTRFSGIERGDLLRNPTKSLKQVQDDLLRFITADTILIGHGLENDFKALRIRHDKVVDTSVSFPHYYGLPYRRSLKSLVKCYLKRHIQNGEKGHDPFEDALASIELMLWKIRKDIVDSERAYK